MTPKGESQKSRTVVVEDHPVLCDGLKQLINSQPDLACVGVADNISDAKRLVEQCKPDLMVLDLRPQLVDRVMLHVIHERHAVGVADREAGHV